MTVDAALAYTAMWPFILGAVLTFIGFGTWYINENPRVGAPVGAVGSLFVLAAVTMWIVSMWMQVKA